MVTYAFRVQFLTKRNIPEMYECEFKFSGTSLEHAKQSVFDFLFECTEQSDFYRIVGFREIEADDC